MLPKDEPADPLRLSYAECAATFAELFPPPWWTADALAELAPLDWSQSPLRLAFHPTVEQVYEETVRMHRNIESLSKAVYHFPRLRLIDMRPLRDALKEQAEPEWTNYSPEDAFAQQQADEEREAEVAKMRESLDEAHREAVEQAQHLPPPPTVVAYQAVHGHFPRGWPPEVEEG